MKTLCAKRHCVTHTIRAQSLVELALVLPLLAMLLISVFEFGMLLYAHIQVSNAAREAARAASLYRSTRYSTDTNGTIIKCNGVEGTTMQQTIQQAIVRYQTSNGCPQASGTVASTSLGWLPTAPTPAWSISWNGTLQSDGMPQAGSSGTITLLYPYHLIVLSKLIPSLQNPMTISKSVAFEFQQ